MKTIITFILFILANDIYAAAENSIKMNVTSIESREGSAHDIYFSGAVPDQGCTYQNRAILDESLAGGETMFSILLAAFIANKQVIIRVDGCATTLVNAPVIIKTQIYP